MAVKSAPFGSRLGEGLVCAKDVMKALGITLSAFKSWHVPVADTDKRNVNWHLLSDVIINRQEDAKNKMMRKSQKYADEKSKASQDLRLATQKADKLEIENEMKRGNLVPIALLRDIIAEASAETAGQLDTIPSMIKRKNPTLERQDIENIKSAIVHVQNSIANMETIAGRKIDDYIAELASKHEY